MPIPRHTHAYPAYVDEIDHLLNVEGLSRLEIAQRLGKTRKQVQDIIDRHALGKSNEKVYRAAKGGNWDFTQDNLKGLRV